MDKDKGDEISDKEDDLDLFFLLPPTPISPILDLKSDEGFVSDSDDSVSSTDEREAHYVSLLGAIRALRDEVEHACVLNQVGEPPMHASQLHLLEHFAEFQPHLFCKKLRVDPEIFNEILDHISDHLIFQSRSNNLQLPVMIQLAIFLNCAGHYGNTISTEDVAQWAGVSVGSVVNCTECTMIALLEQHNKFIIVPKEFSLDSELACRFVDAKSCDAWRGGIFAVDGSTFNLFEKPAHYGETFYDRKSQYSLNCQVWITYFGTMHPFIIEIS